MAKSCHHEGERHLRRDRGKSIGARRGLIAALSAFILGLVPRMNFSTRAEARG